MVGEKRRDKKLSAVERGWAPWVEISVEKFLFSFFFLFRPAVMFETRTNKDSGITRYTKMEWK